MDISPRRDRVDELSYHRKVSRVQTPPPPPKFNRCQLVMGDRLMAAVTMALPFVVCFTTFGIFNLIAGSVLTSMAWKPRNMTRVLLDSPFPREEAVKFREKFVDPLKVMGPILLITGVMLVVVGFALGLTACRSVYGSREPLKITFPAHYSAAIQLSGFNGNNYGKPWIAVPPRKNSVILVPNENKTCPSSTTKVTIESPTSPPFKEAPTNQPDALSQNGNETDLVLSQTIDDGESPSCSYYFPNSTTASPFSHSAKFSRGQKNDLWSSETSFLVAPFELNPETYIT